MLGKVMKYDLKWICKPLLVFYILGLAFSGAARLLSNILIVSNALRSAAWEIFSVMRMCQLSFLFCRVFRSAVRRTASYL